MPSKFSLSPINLQSWINDHRERLKPPVGNAQIWEDGEMIAMVVGGPNQRTDFHVDPVEEFFYQIEGDMVLRVVERPGDPPRDIPIRAGEVFFLPALVPHSPQRPVPGSIGLVIEPKRPPGEKDAFEWYCFACHHRVYRTEVLLQSIVDDLPPLFETFYGDERLRTCSSCGAVHPGRAAPV